MRQHIDNVIFDSEANLLIGPRRRIQLEHRVVQLLRVLAAQPGHAVHRNTLMTHVWTDVVVSDDSLTKAVSELRKALRAAGYDGSGIVTIPKQGYLLDANVEEDHANAAEEHAQPRSTAPSRLPVLAAGIAIIAILFSGRMPTTVTRTLPGDLPEGTLLRVTSYETPSGARIKLRGVSCDQRPNLTLGELRQAMENHRLPEGCHLDY